MVLWTVLAYAPAAEARAWRFHCMVMVYLLLLMLISDSFYSIKTAALLWFLLGTSNAYRSLSLSGKPLRPEPLASRHAMLAAAR